MKKNKYFQKGKQAPQATPIENKTFGDPMCSCCLKPFEKGEKNLELRLGNHYGAVRVTLCEQCKAEVHAITAPTNQA